TRRPPRPEPPAPPRTPSAPCAPAASQAPALPGVQLPRQPPDSRSHPDGSASSADGRRPARVARATRTPCRDGGAREHAHEILVGVADIAAAPAGGALARVAEAIEDLPAAARLEGCEALNRAVELPRAVFRGPDREERLARAASARKAHDEHAAAGGRELDGSCTLGDREQHALAI